MFHACTLIGLFLGYMRRRCGGRNIDIRVDISKIMKNGLSGIHVCWLSALILWICVFSQREAGVLTVRANCIPPSGCLALAYYTAKKGDSVKILSQNFQINAVDLKYFNINVLDINTIDNGSKFYIPFDCTCTNGRLLHTFSYTVKSRDYVEVVVDQVYQNLTTVDDVVVASRLDIYPGRTIFGGNILHIPVKCFCGDPSVSRAYGLFTTYVVQSTDQLTSLATNFNVSAGDISRFNSGAKVRVPYSTMFTPTRGVNRLFSPFIGCNSTSNSTSRNTNSSKTNIDIIVGVVVGVLVLAIVLSFVTCFGRKYLRLWKLAKEHEQQESASFHRGRASLAGSNASRSASIMLADLKSVEFSYEERWPLRR